MLGLGFEDGHQKLTAQQINFFDENGFLIVRPWFNEATLHRFQQTAKQQVNAAQPPLELEVQLGYPGAPLHLDQAGGQTIRRLQGAYQREPLWQAHARSLKLKTCLQQLFGETAIYLSQAHHNCLMTKSPKYSSDTGWHQDRRYWHFMQPELITAWLALGHESKQNGGLSLIPGSHKMSLRESQFDQALFFREDLDENQKILNAAIDIALEPGDLLFFHCNVLHKASRNYTQQVKYSLVFTYYCGLNKPLAKTRSSALPAIPI